MSVAVKFFKMASPNSNSLGYAIVVSTPAGEEVIRYLVPHRSGGSIPNGADVVDSPPSRRPTSTDEVSPPTPQASASLENAISPPSASASADDFWSRLRSNLKSVLGRKKFRIGTKLHLVTADGQVLDYDAALPSCPRGPGIMSINRTISSNCSEDLELVEQSDH